MAFITHIPGTRPIEPPPPHPRRLGLGVVGLHEGRTLLLATSRCSKAYPVAGCDLNPDKLAASRAELPDLFYTADYGALLARPDVDIVAIYTPDSMHADHVVQAFEAGKHVLCTKPLVNSLDGARRVLDAGRRSGRRLLVGQSTRFFEPFLRQRADFERARYGSLELADAHYIHRMDWYYAKSPWAASDTDWVFLGLSHPIDLLRWYLGPIRQVHAYGLTSALGREHGLKGFDLYVVNVVGAGGALGRAMGHFGVHELPRARNCIELMLYGSRGTSLAQYHDMRYIHTGAEAKRPGDEVTEKGPADGPVASKGATSTARSLPSGLNPGAMAEVVEDYLYAGRHYYFNSEVHGMHYGEFANYLEHFAGAILDGAPHAPSLEEGVETFCVMEAVRRSAREGRPLDVGPLLRDAGL